MANLNSTEALTAKTDRVLTRAVIAASPIPPAGILTAVSRGSLLGMVRQAAHRIWSKHPLDACWDRTYSPFALLILITYSYLRGECQSAAVVRNLEDDSELQEVWPLLAITPPDVRHFRRQHRRAIVECLALVLTSLPRVDSLALPAPAETAHTDRSNRCLPQGRGFEAYVAAAQDLIDRAVALDALAFDE